MIGVLIRTFSNKMSRGRQFRVGSSPLPCQDFGSASPAFSRHFLRGWNDCHILRLSPKQRRKGKHQTVFVKVEIIC